MLCPEAGVSAESEPTIGNRFSNGLFDQHNRKKPLEGMRRFQRLGEVLFPSCSQTLRAARSTAMIVRETLMNRQVPDQRGEIVCKNLLPMHLLQTCVKP